MAAFAEALGMKPQGLNNYLQGLSAFVKSAVTSVG
jgi:hypothetical protein